MMHRFEIATLGGLFFLTACSQPIVRVQYVPTKVYLPIPATLTAPIAVDLSGATWGSGIGSLEAGLQTCNARLGAIESLKSPDPQTGGGSPKPPINTLR